MERRKIGSGDAVQFYDSEAPRYDADYQQTVHHAEDRVMAGILRRMLRRRDVFVVMDVGCGTGKLIELTRINPCRYWGFDPASRMIAAHNRRYPRHRADCMQWRSLTGVDQFEFAVSLFGSLSHQADIWFALEMIRRKLLPGGRVLLMFYGHRSAGRPSFICGGQPVDTWTYDAETLRLELGVYFEDVRVRGLTLLSERMINLLPRWLAAAYLWLETQTLGRWFPDRAYALIVTGRRGE